MRYRWLFWALAGGLVLLGALPVAANTITQANATDDCTGYTLTVAGKFLSKPTNVNYTITLTPTSGTPIVITDSIHVVPLHGVYSGSNSQTWAHYGATLNGTYTVTGTATLMTPIPHTRKIVFSQTKLNCSVVQGSCLPSSSLAVLVQSSNVTSYVPNGAWITGNTGVQVVALEPSVGSPTSVATPLAVNSCSSNAISGETVCSSNASDVYLINGTTLSSTLTSGGNQFIGFSGGTCETCGVAMNANANQAVLTIGDSSSPSGAALQFLNLATNTFSAPVPLFNYVSEDVLWDQGRNLILSPTEGGNYDLVQTSPSTAEFGNFIGAGEFDSAAEDCTTGIALSTIEFTDELYIADLTQATFTTGSPGTWTTAQQVQVFPEFASFAAGTSGIAITPGTQLGVVTGEFGGNAFGAIQLPATSGSGTPAVVDYATAALPPTPDGAIFQQGLDPHTVTAYLSPNSGKSIGVIANGFDVPPTFLALIDLQGLLSAPRLAGSHQVDPTYDLIAHGVVTYVAVQ